MNTSQTAPVSADRNFAFFEREDGQFSICRAHAKVAGGWIVMDILPTEEKAEAEVARLEAELAG